MLSDMRRNSLLIILYLSVLASALAIVISTHENRQLIITQEELISERDSLDIEWRHLLIEQNSLTEHNRIEKHVREQLNMHRPEAQEVVMIRDE